MIPLTIITGFLGAGKTTLIKALLAQPDLPRLAFIVNEFGTMGFDGGLIGQDIAQENQPSVIELSNGCLCCRVDDDFIPALEAILSHPLKPDHIIVETSGLALPQPLAEALALPEICDAIGLSGIITVVDGLALRDGVFAANPDFGDPHLAFGAGGGEKEREQQIALKEIFNAQLHDAQMVVLAKSDLLDQQELGYANLMIKNRLKAAVKIISSDENGLPIDILLNNSPLDISQNIKNHFHMHQRFATKTISPKPMGSLDECETYIRSLLNKRGILRIKGYIQLESDEGYVQVQAVGDVVNLSLDANIKNEAKRNAALIIIGFSNAEFPD